MSAWMSPHKTKGRDADARTPNRRTCVEESPSPCPSARSMPGALLSHSSRSKLKWGIGSSPRRCPKLGTPTRRTSQGDGHFSRSPFGRLSVRRSTCCWMASHVFSGNELGIFDLPCLVV
eukprot:symbB.v1.2.031831.t1/scaffold3739.1/size51156/2